MDSRAGRGVVFLPQEKMNANLVKVLALNEIAVSRGQTFAQMALCWVLRRHEVTSVLIGASSPAQIMEYVGTINDMPAFTAEELAKIDAICRRDDLFPTIAMLPVKTRCAERRRSL